MNTLLLAGMMVAALSPTLAEWEKPTGKAFKIKSLASEALKAVTIDASNNATEGVSFLQTHNNAFRSLRKHTTKSHNENKNKNKKRKGKMRHVTKADVAAHKINAKAERKRRIEGEKRKAARRASIMAIKAKKFESTRKEELQEMEQKNISKLELGFETTGSCTNPIKQDFATDVKHSLFSYINKARSGEDFKARLKEEGTETKFSLNAECGAGKQGVHLTIKMSFTNQDVADFLELKNLPHELSQLKKEAESSKSSNSEIFTNANGWFDTSDVPKVSFLKMVTSKGKIYHLADIDGMGETDLENLFHIPMDLRVD